MQDAFYRHLNDFERWKDVGYKGASDQTKQIINNLMISENNRKLWKHQIEAFLRIVYSYEILRKKSCLLNIVTGGGKTAIIAVVIFWLKTVHGINKFLILTPNLVVRDRLEADFKDNKIFKDFNLFRPEESYLLNELTLHILQSGNPPQGMLESGLLLGNIQQLYTTHITGKRNLAFITNFTNEIAIFNDEAHNTPAREYTNILSILSERAKFRLDTTATPDRADGQQPDSDMIYYYDISKALEDRIIKSIVVYEPEVKLLKLTYTNFNTGERKEVTELDKEFEEAEKQVKPFQWILDPEPMRKQISIALQRLNEQKIRANRRYKPILFVVTMNIREGEIVKNMLENIFRIKTLLVTEESDDVDRKDAREIGSLQSSYEAVVSVLMLREGWDVPEVSTILLLRKFSSPVYGQQVIGRGLRRIIRNKPEPEILAVVDHPRLEHDWLWRLVAVSKIRQNVTDEDSFDVTEDLPLNKIQMLIRPEKLIKIPDPIYDVQINFQKIKDDIPDDTVCEDWKDILDRISYNRETWMISQTKIDIVRGQRLKDKRLELIEGPKDSDVLPEKSESSRDQLEQQFKEMIIDIAGGLLKEAGFAGLMKGKLYNVLMDHISAKVFGGLSLSEAKITDIEFALFIAPDIRKNFTKPIIAGILGE